MTKKEKICFPKNRYLLTTYTDPFKGVFNIGLYHGKDTGHVLVYINNRITIIDFNIKDDKQYSFYLGPELFDLRLHKEMAGFTYSIEKNLEAPTALNEARRRSDREDLQLMSIGGAVISSILMFLFLLG